MNTRDPDKRFGVIAVEKGFVTAEQVIDAMRIQIEEDVEGGEHRLLGAILVENGYLTVPHLDDILREMEAPVIEITVQDEDETPS